MKIMRSCIIKVSLEEKTVKKLTGQIRKEFLQNVVQLYDGWYQNKDIGRGGGRVVGWGHGH